MKDKPKKQYIKIYHILFRLIIVAIFSVLFFLLYTCVGFLLNNYYFDNLKYKELFGFIITGIIFPVIMFAIKQINSTKHIRKLEALTYKKLSTYYLTSNNVVVCLFIEALVNIFYKGKFLELEKQSEICHKILNRIHSVNIDSANKVFLVQGNTHSGKTILVQKIIRELYTNKKYILSLSRTNKIVYYYDFSHINSDFFIELIDLINNCFFEEKIVFLDNVHKLNKQQINYLFQICLNNPQKAKYIVILSRDIQYILTDDVKKIIEEKRLSECLICDDLSEVDSNCIYNDQYFDFINKLIIDDKSFFNDYIKFEMFYVYDVYKKNKSKYIFKLFDDITKRNYHSSSLLQFMFICCASVFTGFFNANQFKLWCKKNNLKSEIRLICKSGLIIQFANIESDYYSLHEKAAKSYVSYFCEDYQGVEQCKKIFQFLIDSYEDFNLKYRYSIPLQNSATFSFDKVIMHGDYGILFDDLQYLIKTFSLNESDFCKEFGLLYDRIGEYKLTEKNIRTLYNSSHNEYYLITLLHANHMALFDIDLSDKYKKLLNSDDPYLKFASNYWRQHIHMHYGKWDLAGFIDLADELVNHKKYISEKSYEGFHLMRRYYFDCLRIYYLQGELDYNVLNKIITKLMFLSDLLKAKVPDYEYYVYKFIYAHFIHYDLLFKNKILGANINLHELTFAKVSSIGNLEKDALSYYYKAFENMKKNKDKAADYVLLRICELDPAFALNKIFHKHCGELESFTNDNFFDMISVYDNFKEEKGLNQGVQEYAAFAETYKIKFTLVCQLSCPNVTVDFSELINESLSNARKYHDSYFMQGTNIYGGLRLDLYMSISAYLSCHNYEEFKDNLEKMKEICLENRFNRELKLIKNILTKGSEISPSYIKNIVTYYPIVLQ